MTKLCRSNYQNTQKVSVETSNRAPSLLDIILNKQYKRDSLGYSTVSFMTYNEFLQLILNLLILSQCKQLMDMYDNETVRNIVAEDLIKMSANTL